MQSAHGLSVAIKVYSCLSINLDVNAKENQTRKTPKIGQIALTVASILGSLWYADQLYITHSQQLKKVSIQPIHIFSELAPLALWLTYSLFVSFSIFYNLKVQGLNKMSKLGILGVFSLLLLSSFSILIIMASITSKTLIFVIS